MSLARDCGITDDSYLRRTVKMIFTAFAFFGRKRTFYVISGIRTMIQAILVGVGLSAATIILHALGTLWWISLMRRWFGEARPKAKKMDELMTPSNFRHAALVLAVTTSLLVFMHVLEVALWGFCYLMLPIGPTPSGVENAMYFSTVTFTSLGYGDVVIQGHWRILSGIQAMAGLLVFGWSTALLMTTFTKMLEVDRTQANSQED